MTKQHDEIEFCEPKHFDCDCCGHQTTRLTRFVTRKGAAFAVYFAQFSDGPEHDDVQVLVGFGPWGEDAGPEERTAIAFTIWNTEENFNVGLMDADRCGWKTDYLGRRLSREEALASSWKQEVFDLSDHIVMCDQPIVDYLKLHVRRS